MISCIILAAGESRRFGSPKALARLGGVAILSRTQQMLLDAGLEEIIVVVGAHSESVKPQVFNHTHVRVVYNKDYKLGQTSSFQAGVRETSDKSRGFMLVPVDCPCINPETIRQLLRHCQHQQPAIVIPVFDGRRGHPPVFHADLKTEIVSLSPAEGLNSLFQLHPPSLLKVDDAGILQTFNTPEEFGKLTIG